MGKCSNYTGHDGATGAQRAMPLPDEVAVDIEALEVWRKERDYQVRLREANLRVQAGRSSAAKAVTLPPPAET